MNFVRFECQVHPEEPPFFAFDFRGSYTPVFVFEDMKRGTKPDLSNDRLAIDIGANIGMWSLRMAMQYPNTKFIAYEPYSINVRHLIMGVQVNNLKNIEVIDRAITHDGQDVTLVMDPTNSGSASAYNTIKSEMYPKERVRSVSLNEVVAPHEKVDALKIDIEGAEFMLFEGFEYWDKLKKVYVEVHPNYAGITEAEKEYTIKTFLELLRGKLGRENVFVDCTEDKYRTF